MYVNYKSVGHCQACQGMSIESLIQRDNAEYQAFKRSGLQSSDCTVPRATNKEVNGSGSSVAIGRNESVARRYPYRHLDFGLLRKSARSCPLCDVIRSELESAIEQNHRSDVGDEWTLHVGLALEPGPLGPRVHLLSQSLDLRNTANLEPVTARLLVYTVENDPTMSLGLRPLRLLPQNTRSLTSIATARRWLTDCVEKHNDLSTQHPPELRNVADAVRPRRLVYARKSGNGLSLRLIDESDTASPYATLSHCWGPGPWTWRTLKDNLAYRQSGFNDADLPPTIRDACFTALELDISYIWVDCLCIVQDDDADWALEAPRMASIYYGALVTIAATAARSSRDGLFNIQSSSPLPNSNTLEKVEAILSTGSRSTLIFVPRTAWRDGSGLYGSPLLRRAWVCQERMCSRRIVHFAASQLFWECEHCLMSEDNTHQGEGNTDFYRSRQMMLSVYRSTDSRSAPAMERICGHWYEELIWLYSQSGLTFGRDKLIAIAGLAKVIHDRTGMQYFAGHRYGSELLFLESLFWYRTGPGSKSLFYRAPSWSWASQDTAIAYSWTWHGGDTYSGSMYSCSKVERLCLIPKPPNTTPFGLISSGEIVLTGFLSEHDMRHCDNSAAVKDEYVISVGCHGGKDILDSSNYPDCTRVYVLVIMSSEQFGIRYLLLTPVEPASNVMKRIGVGETEPIRKLEEIGDEKKILFAKQLLHGPMQTVTIV